MTIKEAHETLAWRDDEGNLKPIAKRLRAHAALWRNGPMSEHAHYCDEAADTIEELEQKTVDLNALHSGEAIVIPRNRDHAEKMMMIAEHWLKTNGGRVD